MPQIPQTDEPIGQKFEIVERDDAIFVDVQEIVKAPHFPPPKFVVTL